MGEGAIQAASGTGGFGNKQTATAMESVKIVYKDILIHNLHVSIQEFQKMSKMYQKKITKRRHQELIAPPEMQYMNIYKSSAKRLGCFEEINEEYDQQNKGEFLPNEYSFFGDATQYEKYLESELKSVMNEEKLQNSQRQQQMTQVVFNTQPALNLEALTFNLASCLKQAVVYWAAKSHR